jgi:hypothetical protein
VDFVVVGFGLGALGVLLGVVMLGWLAPRSQRAAARNSAADDAARHRAIAAEHRGTGQAFLYAGGAMLLATVAGLLGSLDDRTGAFLVTTTATVAAVGILLGGYLQRARNPIPPRRRNRSAPVASVSSLTAPPLADTPSLFAHEPAQVHDPVAVESEVEGPHAAVLPVSDSAAAAFTAEETAPVPSAASATLSSGTTDPGSLDDSPVAAETADAGSWQPADHTESSPSRPDEDDPSSGHS